MINLIPNQEKKKMTKDFYFRLVVVSFVMLGFSIFVGSTTILPSFFLSVVRKNVANAKLETQKKEPIPDLDQKTLDIIKDLENKLSLVENAEKNKFNISEKVIKEISSKKTSDIKITKIIYNSTIQNGRKISIEGSASSRENLLSFSKALKEDPLFKEVDLPVSNFIKGSNIQFYLNLIPL
jgi:Tfp pilus assembly protein PilN